VGEYEDWKAGLKLGKGAGGRAGSGWDEEVVEGEFRWDMIVRDGRDGRVGNADEWWVRGREILK
jgi:hypothetical protein